jgi:tripartite-type tricarboxylate transporter receptor subunit TctC
MIRESPNKHRMTSRRNGRHSLRAALTACALALIATGHAGPSYAQSERWPSKPIRIVVPYPPSGPTDTTARVIAPRMSEALGRQIVIDNRSGANTLIGTEMVAKAPPDGHTLLMVTSTISINPSTYKKLPYDTLRDLLPVTMVVSTPFMLIVHPSLPVKTPVDLFRLAKARPGHLLYPSSGVGSANHLAIALLSRMAGVETTHVPYKGTAQWMTDIVAGQMHFAMTNPIASLPLAKVNKVRLLATSGSRRLQLMPEVPTIAETAIPGYEAGNWHGMFAPAGTPQEIVNRLHAEVAKALAAPDIEARFVESGAHVGGTSPERFSAFFRSEVAKWAKAVKVAGVTTE